MIAFYALFRYTTCTMNTELLRQTAAALEANIGLETSEKR